MNRQLLILRPQPGNDATARAARGLGLEVVQLPLFEIVPIEAGAPPPGPFDALLVTSANGARHGKDVLALFAELPVYTVGEATAQAICEHGERIVHIGGGDAASTLPIIAAAGHKRLLHLCGEEVRDFDPLGLIVTQHVVYRSEARDMRPFTKMLATLPPLVIAVHSPAAGRRLNALMPPSCRNHLVVAISDAAGKAAGTGWRRVHVADAPDDSALLRLATSLCIGAS